MQNGVPRILMIRLSAIGDVVRVLPAVHALRDAFPNAQLDFAIEPKSQDVVTDHPAIDNVLLFERVDTAWQGSAAFLAFCRDLRDRRYDIVVDFHGILKSGLMARATGARKRYGFATPRSQEMSHLCYTHRVPLVSQRMNRIIENLELVKALDARRNRLDVRIGIPEDVADDIDDFLHAAYDSGKQLAVLHVPVERPEKQWPLQHFAHLSDLLMADGRFEVLLTYGPGQQDIAEEAAALSKRLPRVAPNLPTLKHFAALMPHACVFFGGDTGPMHIASAMDVPTVVVFGGTDPEKHAPMRKPFAVLYAGPDPFPTKMPLAKAQQLLEAITPEQAYDACVKVVHGG